MGIVASAEKEMNQDSTEGLIRSLMTEQKRGQSRSALPVLTPVDEDSTEQISESVRHAISEDAAAERSSPDRASLKDRIRGYRPTRKHIVLAVLAFVVVMRPWLIPGILFVSFWVGLIIWLTLGPDRITEWLASMWDRICTRKPDLAEKLRQRGDAFALKFDAILDKLPTKWADKLALPDMSVETAQNRDLDAEPDPFEKLKLPEVYRG